MTKRNVREMWIGRDEGRHYYGVSEAEDDTVADDGAVVVVETNTATCYRCQVTADITFKCIHIHEVKRTLDL